MVKSGDFHEEQISVLNPLVEATALVRVPLFANTLPLAYHYGSALRRKHGSNASALAGLIPWGAPPLVQLVEEAHGREAPSPAIFYCTKAYLEQLTTFLLTSSDSLRSRREEFNGIGRISYTPVTIYQPRYLFVRKSMRLRRLLGPSQFSGTVREFGKDIAGTAERVEVYTDTPDQARALEQFLKEELVRQDVRVIDPADQLALDAPRRPHSAVDFYYFSAPCTTVLLNDDRFVPLELPRGLVDDIPHDFETGVAIVPPNSMSASTVSEIQDALAKYHLSLYNKCSEGDAHTHTANFLELTWVYNRLARAQRITDTFQSESQFARCLSEHHLPPAAHSGIG